MSRTLSLLTKGGISVSIRVLNLDGRVLRPVSPSCAKSKVKHFSAKWLHAQGVEPDRQHGTIVLKDSVRNPPPDRVQTQVYNANGQLLGWIWPEIASRVLEKKQCNLVGTYMQNGPRALIIPRLVSKAATKELRYIESRRTAEAAIQRAFLRDRITEIINNAKNWTDVEEKVDSLLEQHLNEYEKENVLSDIMYIRKKISALEIAIAPDLVEVKHEIAAKLGM
jgi:predicted house-cleaning noncanonical NTP pyrophosphatase (MazG superfamily)